MSTPQRTRRGGSATLDAVTGEPPPPEEKKEGQGAAPAPAADPVVIPVLPTAKTAASTDLRHKTILIYGDRGVGKSSLAASFGEVLFFDCAGELSEIEAYKLPVHSWKDFRAGGAALKQAHEAGAMPYTGCAIDTVDVLGMYCAQAGRAKLGIAHESDAEWGKGWAMVKESFQSNLAKLMAIPDFGVILISHAKQVKIKTRREEYDKAMPTLTGGVRDVCLDAPDLVLFIDYNEDGERVIRTKPGKEWEAKERGQTPRLPEEILWPLDRSGYEVLAEAWSA